MDDDYLAPKVMLKRMEMEKFFPLRVVLLPLKRKMMPIGREDRMPMMVTLLLLLFLLPETDTNDVGGQRLLSP